MTHAIRPSFLSAAAVLAISILLAACKAQGPTQADHPDGNVAATSASAPASEPKASPGATIRSSGGTYLLEVAPAPAQMPANQLFSIRIVIRDSAADHRVIRDASLAVDATMPAHHHGMNTRPKITRNADGSFTAAGMLLHMSGDWEVTFDITRNGVTERAVLPVIIE